MSKILEDVLAGAIANQYIFAKVRFDNAKDTNDLIFAAEENAQLLLQIIEHMLGDRREELLIELLAEMLAEGKPVVQIRGESYELNKIES